MPCSVAPSWPCCGKTRQSKRLSSILVVQSRISGNLLSSLFIHCCSRRHCCHRFVIVTARPHLRRNPLRRKKRQKKSIFIYGTTFKKNESGSNFQQIQIWNDCSQNQKKNYGRQPMAGTKFYLGIQCCTAHLLCLIEDEVASPCCLRRH